MKDHNIEKEIEILLKKKNWKELLKDWHLKYLKRSKVLVPCYLLEYQQEEFIYQKLLAHYLEELSDQPIEHGCLDPTFHRDDLSRVGTRIGQGTDLPSSVEDREVVLIDDVIFYRENYTSCS